jgi:hypothetical protein
MRLILLVSSLSQFSYLSIQCYPIYHYYRLAFCFLFALPASVKLFTQIILLVAAALFMLHAGQNKTGLSPMSTSSVFESTNYKHKNTGSSQVKSS